MVNKLEECTWEVMMASCASVQMKDYTERIMTRKMIGHDIDGNVVEGPVDCVCRDEVV